MARRSLSCYTYPVHAPVAQRIELGVPNSFQGIPLTYLNDTETPFFQYVTYLSLVVPTCGKMYPYIRKVPTANRVPVRSHSSHRCGLSTPATLEPAVTQILVQTKLNLNNEFAMERREGGLRISMRREMRCSCLAGLRGILEHSGTRNTYSWNPSRPRPLWSSRVAWP